MNSIPLTSLSITRPNNEPSDGCYRNRFNYASSKCSAMIVSSGTECIHTSSILNEDKDLYMNVPCEPKLQDSNYFFNVFSRFLSSKQQSEIHSWTPFDPAESISIYYLDIELCSEIKIDEIALANYELFSGIFRHFTIWSSDYYPPNPTLHSSIISSFTWYPGNITCTSSPFQDNSKNSNSCQLYKNGWRFLGHFEANPIREMQFFSLLQTQSQFVKYIRLEVHTYYGNEYYCPISVFRVYGTTMMEEYKSLQSASHIQNGIKSIESSLFNIKINHDIISRNNQNIASFKSLKDPSLSFANFTTIENNSRKTVWTMNDKCPYLSCHFQVKSFLKQSPASWNMKRTFKKDQDSHEQILQGNQVPFQHGDNIFKHFTDRLKDLEFNVTRTLEVIKLLDNEQRNFLQRIEHLATRQAMISIESLYKDFQDSVNQVMLDANRQWSMFSDRLQHEQIEKTAMTKTLNDQTTVQILFIIIQLSIIILVLIIVYWNKLKKCIAASKKIIAPNTAKNEFITPKSPLYHTSVDLDDTGIIPGAEYHLSSDTINKLEHDDNLHLFSEHGIISVSFNHQENNGNMTLRDRTSSRYKHINNQ